MEMLFQRLFFAIPVIVMFIGMAAYQAYEAHKKIVSRKSLKASIRSLEEQEEPLEALRAQRKGALSVMGIGIVVLAVFGAGLAMTIG